MTGPVDDLTAFLNARDSEAERADWHHIECQFNGGTRACDCKKHDWVLDVIAYKRRAAEGHEPVRGVVDYIGTKPEYGMVCATCGTEESREMWPCRHIRILAKAYASHPDYREEWRP